MKTKFVLLAICVALAGCQATPMASTPRSITFNGFGNASLQDATLKAQVHCQQFGRDAEIVPTGYEDGTRTFRCLDKR